MRASLWDSLEWVYPDSDVGAGMGAAEVNVARGGAAAVQVFVSGLKGGAALVAALKEKGRAVRGARWFRLHDVPVEQNTGPVARTCGEGEENPHVTRKAPFRVYDAMEPIGGTVEAQAGTLALRVHVEIEREARPGRREYVVEVTCGTSPPRLQSSRIVARP